MSARLLDDGLSVAALVTDLLAPAQVKVGLRWQRGEWTAAQEATATSVVDAVLSSLHDRAPSTPTRGRVAVSTVEGDWHAIGARMVAEVLRDEGFAVDFLGPSVPALRLPKLLTVDTDAVVLSCSMPCHLPSARRGAEVVLDARYPVVLGGHAVTTAQRARALGASGWAPTAAGAVGAVLCALEARAHPVRATEEETMLDASRAELVERVVDGLIMEWPDLARLDAVALNRVRIAVDRLVATVQASVMLQDDSVLDEYVAWLIELDAAGQGEAPPGAMLAAAEAALEGFGAAQAAVRRVRAATRPLGAHQRIPSVPAAVPPGNSSSAAANAEQTLRARASAATHRLTQSLPAAAPSADQSAVRVRADKLLQEVDRLRRRSETGAYGDSAARSHETLEAARAQAARLLAEAEHDAERIRRDAVADAEAVAAAAGASATALIEQAEQEGLEMLAEAAEEVVQRLDDAARDAERIVAEATADAAAREAAIAERETAFRAAVDRRAKDVEDDIERQLSAASVAANEILVRARADAAQIAAAAQRERSEVAEEAANLVAEAVTQLDRARADADELQRRVADRRASVEDEIETDVRRLLAEAQRECDDIVAAAHDEAARIVAAAKAEVARPALDLRDAEHAEYDESRKKRRWRA